MAEGSKFNDDEVADILRDFRKDLPELAKESIGSAAKPGDQAFSTFQSLLDKFNKKNGLNLKINFVSLFDNMPMLSEGNNRRLVELYISDTWQDFRTIFFLRILMCLVILSDKIASPERLGDMSTTLDSDMNMVNQFFDLINKLSNLGQQIGIFDTNAELTRMHKEEDAKKMGGQDNALAKQILDKLWDSIRGKEGQDNNKIEDKGL
jgi:hypothetical protein